MSPAHLCSTQSFLHTTTALPLGFLRVAAVLVEKPPHTAHQQMRSSQSEVLCALLVALSPLSSRPVFRGQKQQMCVDLNTGMLHSGEAVLTGTNQA